MKRSWENEAVSFQGGEMWDMKRSDANGESEAVRLNEASELLRGRFFPQQTRQLRRCRWLNSGSPFIIIFFLFPYQPWIRA